MTAALLVTEEEWTDTVPARTALIERLQETPPGSELAGLLASIDRSSLDIEGLLRVAQARQRLIAHQEAQFLSDMHAVARAVPHQGSQPGRRDVPGKYPWAEVEAACALRWSYGRAGAHMILADEVIDRLPAIHDAVVTGQIDMPKVHLMTDLVSSLDDEPARQLIDKVIGKAPQQTTAELRARLRRLVLAVDAEALSKRARRRSADRRVQAFVNENQLANLAGYDLAPHRVAAIMERLDAIAKAARAAGDPRRADQIRADAYLDLLAGEGIAAGGPITDGGIDRPADVPGPEDAITAGAPGPVAPADRSLLDSDPQPQDLPIDPEPAADLWAFGIPEPPPQDGDDPPLSEARDVVEPDEREREALWLAGFRQLLPTAGMAGRGGGAALPGPRRGVIELQVPLTTLVGLCQLPGELGGWAPVVADIARQVAEQMRDGTWRFSVYDVFGELAYHGITNKRPATARFPSAEQAAYVRARDRMCVAPGCRRSARTCEIDHTLPWADSGPTDTCNLSLLCRRHHVFKHAAGCELLQLSSGSFAWKFPSGLQYVTRSDTPLIDDNQLAELPKLIAAGDIVDP